MKKPKKYEITNFERLLNVANVENFERLSIDLLSWLHHYVIVIDSVRKEQPELCKGKTNAELIGSTFTWTDDGVEGVTSAELIDTKTGEKKELKIRK